MGILKFLVRQACTKVCESHVSEAMPSHALGANSYFRVPLVTFLIGLRSLLITPHQQTKYAMMLMLSELLVRSRAMLLARAAVLCLAAAVVGHRLFGRTACTK